MTQELSPLDPELEAALADVPDEYLTSNLIDFDDMPASRTRAAEMTEMMMAEMPDRQSVESEDITVPGRGDGPEVPLRVYRPVDAGGDRPCLYWIHGGGMVIGGLDGEDPHCERFVDELGCVVVSVDYRLAPEHPYPAPVDDCYAGLVWVAENAEEIGIDPSRVAIAGPSAGGGLSAAVALRARDAGDPELCFQLLIYPMLDDRNVTVSSEQVTDIGIWDREMNVRAWEMYLGDMSGADELPPYAAPGRVEDLSGLPPTYVDIGTHDLFRDETTAYVDRLVKAGVPTEFHLWPGAFHGYERYAPEAELTTRTWSARFTALERAFAE